MAEDLLQASGVKPSTFEANVKAANPAAGARDLLAPIASPARPQDTHPFGIPNDIEEG